MWRYKLTTQRGNSTKYLDGYSLYGMSRSLEYIRTSSAVDPLKLNNTTSIVIFQE